MKHRTTSGNSFHPKIEGMYYLSGENRNVLLPALVKEK
jgi:hypothetical protein